MISTSEIKISVLIAEEYTELALRALHTAYGLRRPVRQTCGSAPGAAHLHELWRRGAEFLGCRFAILGGAMTWVSERNLVAAISNAGGFGVIACGAMTPPLLAELKATRHSPPSRSASTSSPCIPS